MGSKTTPLTTPNTDIVNFRKCLGTDVLGAVDLRSLYPSKQTYLKGAIKVG